MPITAKLHNGSALEFPDGTPDDVIDKAVMEALATPESSLVKGDPPPPSFTDSLIQQAPQTAGGIALGVGAVAAGASTIPAVAAVGLGGGFGESMRQVGQHIAGSPDAPKSATEAALRIGKAGGTEAAFDVFGRLVMGGVGKVLAPFKSRMAEGAADAIKMFKGKITPVVFTPAEATQSRVLDIMQNVIDVSIVGGNSMSDFKVARTKFFDEFADSLIDQFGSRTSPEELGNLFVASIEKKREVHGKVAQVLYNNVEELVNSRVDEMVRANVGGGLVSENTEGALKTISGKIDSVSNDIINGGSFKGVYREGKDIYIPKKSANVLTEESDPFKYAKKLLDDKGTYSKENMVKYLKENTSFDAVIFQGEDVTVINKTAFTKTKNVDSIKKYITPEIEKEVYLNAPKGKVRLYHGRKEPLQRGFKTKEGVGIHFSNNPKVAIDVGVTGGTGGKSSKGTINAMEIDESSKFLELPDYVPDTEVDSLWTIDSIKQKLISSESGISPSVINGISDESSLFKVLKEHGFDGIKYNDSITSVGESSVSYLLPREIVGDNISTVNIPKGATEYTQDELNKILVKLSKGIPASKQTGTSKPAVSADFIPTNVLKNFARHPRKLADNLGGIEAKNAGDDLMSAIMDLPDNIDFNTAKELRSRLISRVDEFSVINKKAPAIGKARRLISLLDEQIGTSLKQLDNIPLKNAGKSNVSVTKKGKGKGTFNKYVIKSGDEEVGSFNLSPKDNGFGYIEDFNIEENSRNLGIGKKAIEESNNALHKAGYRKLLIDVANDGPVEFWEKSGFRKVNTGPTSTRMAKEIELTGGSKGVSEPSIPVVSESGRQSPYEAWRTANRFYKEGQEQFNNVFIRRMVKLADETGTGAENIAPKIFRPGQISQVRKVKNAVDSETWNKLQGFFVGHLMDQSTDTEGKIVGDRLLNKLSGKPGSYGMDMLNETLSQPQVRELVNFGKALKLTQAGQSEGTGKVLVQLSQAGALMMLARGQLKIPAATILIGPAVLSKMMLNPVTCRMLTAGVQLPAHSPQAAGILSRIVAASARIKGDTDDSKIGRKP